MSSSLPCDMIGNIIYGGLGNRLFQVAAAYAGSLDQGKKLAIVFHAVNPHSKQDYRQSVFHQVTDGLMLSPFFIDNVDYLKSMGIPEDYISFCRQQKMPTQDRLIMNELNAQDYIPFPVSSDNLFVSGYFENTKYFDHRRKEILELYKPTEEMVEKIKHKYPHHDKSISLHQRVSRVHLDNPSEFFLCVNYMEKSIERMQSIYGKDVHVYVMSSSSDVKNVMPYLSKLSNWTLVDTEDELETLYLMSMCSLGCINDKSTLSWWGNYLNPNPDKVFISNCVVGGDWR